MSTGRRFASSALLAFWVAPAAHAGDELYLRWDNCIGDGGVYNKTFACDTNSGSETLVGSFRLAETTDQINGLEILVDLTTLDPAIPAWWNMQATIGCRPTTLTASFSAPATATTCLDAYAATAGGGSAYFSSYPRPNTAQLRIVVAVPDANAFTAPVGQEMFAFAVTIDHAHTTGLGSCDGCTTPMCIAWDAASVVLVQPLDRIRILGAYTPQNGANVTWQPGAVTTQWASCSPTHGCEWELICQSVTPTRRSTWGSIKSLYR